MASDSDVRMETSTIDLSETLYYSQLSDQLAVGSPKISPTTSQAKLSLSDASSATTTQSCRKIRTKLDSCTTMVRNNACLQPVNLNVSAASSLRLRTKSLTSDHLLEMNRNGACSAKSPRSMQIRTQPNKTLALLEKSDQIIKRMPHFACASQTMVRCQVMRIQAALFLTSAQAATTLSRHRFASTIFPTVVI